MPPPDATSKSRKQKWHRGSTNKRGESQGWDGGDGVARRPYHQRFANAPGCNSFRVDEFPGRLPRVGTARQPWAGRGNPVGIREGVNRPSPQAEGRCVVRPSDSVPPPDAARGGEGGRGKEELKIINDKVGTRARGERGGDEPSPPRLGRQPWGADGDGIRRWRPRSRGNQTASSGRPEDGAPAELKTLFFGCWFYKYISPTGFRGGRGDSRRSSGQDWTGEDAGEAKRVLRKGEA